MFREQFDRRAIGVGIGLHEILHGFHQETLALDVTRVRNARLTDFWFRTYGNRKQLGHENPGREVSARDGPRFCVAMVASIEADLLCYQINNDLSRWGGQREFSTL